MTDRSDAVVIQYTPPRGRRRKVVFEPRSVGGWERTTYEWRDRWRPTGTEIVAELEIEDGAR